MIRFATERGSEAHEACLDAMLLYGGYLVTEDAVVELIGAVVETPETFRWAAREVEYAGTA